jgi:hypothetical protein
MPRSTTTSVAWIMMSGTVPLPKSWIPCRGQAGELWRLSNLQLTTHCTALSRSSFCPWDRTWPRNIRTGIQHPSTFRQIRTSLPSGICQPMLATASINIRRMIVNWPATKPPGARAMDFSGREMVGRNSGNQGRGRKSESRPCDRLRVDRDGIEPPTHGFSVHCSTI